MNKSEPENFDALMSAFAKNTYKLSLMAAELGMTGEEPAEELQAAVKRLKAGQPAKPQPANSV
jgi:hypothetical protein